MALVPATQSNLWFSVRGMNSIDIGEIKSVVLGARGSNFMQHRS
jgi:hypothetical protein